MNLKILPSANEDLINGYYFYNLDKTKVGKNVTNIFGNNRAMTSIEPLTFHIFPLILASFPELSR